MNKLLINLVILNEDADKTDLSALQADFFQVIAMQSPEKFWKYAEGKDFSEDTYRHFVIKSLQDDLAARYSAMKQIQEFNKFCAGSPLPLIGCD